MIISHNLAKNYMENKNEDFFIIAKKEQVLLFYVIKIWAVCQMGGWGLGGCRT